VDELIGQILYQRYQIRSLLGKKIGRRTFLAIALKFDNFTQKYIDWLSLLVELNLSFRLKSAEQAKLLLEQPDRMVKIDR
jgi:hypothetical protein